MRRSARGYTPLCAALTPQRGHRPRGWPRPAAGGRRLVSAVSRTGGPAPWARELGLPLAREPWTPERVDAALRPLLEGRRTWPSRREFHEAGLLRLYHAIRAREGHPSLAARYRLPLQRPTRHRPPTRRRA